MTENIQPQMPEPDWDAAGFHARTAEGARLLVSRTDAGAIRITKHGPDAGDERVSIEIPASAVGLLLALTNAVLPAGHPAKITWPRCNELRAVLKMVAPDRDTQEKENSAFLDGLESLLPPRGIVSSATTK